MVNVGDKAVTDRVARASGIVRMQASTRRLIVDHGHSKGDVLEVARLAGIMAAKRTADLIPLCHPLALQSVQLDLQPLDDDAIRIEATVEVTAKTGVEMEALTAVSVAALTIYDMCKAVDQGITIEQVQLEEKSGGKSGPYCRKVTVHGKRSNRSREKKLKHRGTERTEFFIVFYRIGKFNAEFAEAQRTGLFHCVSPHRRFRLAPSAKTENTKKH